MPREPIRTSTVMNWEIGDADVRELIIKGMIDGRHLDGVEDIGDCFAIFLPLQGLRMPLETLEVFATKQCSTGQGKELMEIYFRELMRRVLICNAIEKPDECFSSK